MCSRRAANWRALEVVIGQRDSKGFERDRAIVGPMNLVDSFDSAIRRFVLRNTKDLFIRKKVQRHAAAEERCVPTNIRCNRVLEWGQCGSAFAAIYRCSNKVDRVLRGEDGEKRCTKRVESSQN